MVFKQSDLKGDMIEGLLGGKGSVCLTPLDTALLPEKCGLFAKLTLPAGSTVGEHEHVGEAEVFCFLSGSGFVTDDGERVKIERGDVMITVSGHRHSIENTGKEDMELIAVIIKA